MPAPGATAYDVARRMVGLRELPGAAHNPAIIAMLNWIDRSVHDDETPWCSAFVNYIAMLLGLPRSASLAARSWLAVGASIPFDRAVCGYDVVILTRGENAPPASVIQAPGHVGFFAGASADGTIVRVLGGNQGNMVSIADFPRSRVLGVRRLASA